MSVNSSINRRNDIKQLLIELCHLTDTRFDYSLDEKLGMEFVIDLALDQNVTIVIQRI